MVWTPETNGRIVVSKELALELVHETSTAVNTDVQVQCDFTFTHYDGITTEIDSCPHSFTITACEAPTIETFGEESMCKAGECLSPTGMPGPFEACSGSVFMTEGSTTKQKTLTGDCCAECSTPLACTALHESNGVDGVERCEPATTSTLILMSLRGEAEWKDVATPSMVMALMGVTALVVAVALVVVKRRNRAARGEDEYDAYHPLLS